MDSILRFHQIQKLINLSRSTIWRMEKLGTFPHRIQLSSHSVGWRQSEIQSWIEQRKLASFVKQDSI